MFKVELDTRRVACIYFLLVFLDFFLTSFFFFLDLGFLASSGVLNHFWKQSLCFFVAGESSSSLFFLYVEKGEEIKIFIVFLKSKSYKKWFFEFFNIKLKQFQDYLQKCREKMGEIYYNSPWFWDWFSFFKNRSLWNVPLSSIPLSFSLFGDHDPSRDPNGVPVMAHVGCNCGWEVVVVVDPVDASLCLSLSDETFGQVHEEVDKGGGEAFYIFFERFGGPPMV